MVSWIGLIIIIWSLTDIHGCIAFDIDCNTNPNCKQSTIECLPDEDCFISCERSKSCKGSTIICPQNGDCNIKCRGGQSCMDSIINATQQSPLYNFNLLCQESTDHCKNIAVYGSKVAIDPDLDTNLNGEYNNKFNISCDGLLRSCVNSEFHCPTNGDCFVSCNADSGCRGTDIFGPESHEHLLHIECNNVKSCFDGNFDGSSSSKLEITGCVDSESCYDLSIYCPPFSNNRNKNCFISGNENIGRDNAGGTKIFAINGWNDIDIDYNGTYGIHHGGKMYCGTEYQYSCNIAPNNWSCDNSDDVDGLCNNPISTTMYTTLSTWWDINDTKTNTDNINDNNDGAYDGDDEEIDDESQETFAVFSDDWPFESRILFGIGVILIIIIVGFYCYCTNRQNKGFPHLHHRRLSKPKKPTREALKAKYNRDSKNSNKKKQHRQVKHQHIRSWPKMDTGITPNEFRRTSSIKKQSNVQKYEEEDETDDDYYDDDETDMMSTPQVKTASIHPRSEPRSPLIVEENHYHHGHHDHHDHHHDEEDLSKTHTFPETAVQIPHHMLLKSSLPGATKLHENTFVTMIEEQHQGNNKKDPRSPPHHKLSVPDNLKLSLKRYPSNSDDILHLNRERVTYRERMMTTNGNHRFMVSAANLSKSSHGSYVEMTPSETDHDHHHHHHSHEDDLESFDAINYRKPSARLVDDTTIHDGKIDMEDVDRTDIVINPTNTKQQTVTEQEKLRLFTPTADTEHDRKLNAEMMNPVNTLPTTAPSAIFSPPHSQYL